MSDHDCATHPDCRDGYCRAEHLRMTNGGRMTWTPPASAEPVRSHP